MRSLVLTVLLLLVPGRLSAQASQPASRSGDAASSATGVGVDELLSFRLSVIHAETRKPVEEFAVRCHLRRTASSEQRAPRLSGRHPDGLVLVDKVLPGVNRLIVIPKDPTLAESEEILIDATEPPLKTVHVELSRKATLTVRVVDRNGQPLHGSTVELVDPLGNGFDALTDALEPRPDMSLRGPKPQILSVTKTDRLGRASLRLPAETEGLLAVRVRGKGHTTFVRKDIKPEKGQPLIELVAPQPARIQGKVTPAEIGTVHDLRVLLRTPGDNLGPDKAFKIPLAADGTFTFEHLPAQEVEVVLEARFDAKPKHLVGDLASRRPLKGITKRLTLKEGETATVALDASECKPGRFRARILDQGAPARGAVVFYLRSPTIHGSAGFGEFQPGEDGWIDIPAVLPGRYTAGLRVSEIKEIELEGEFTLEPGKTGEWTFRVPAAK